MVSAMLAIMTEAAISLIGFVLSTCAVLIASPALAFLGLVIGGVGIGMLLRRAIDAKS